MNQPNAAQTGWDKKKRDAPRERELETEALALRRSGMSYEQIAKHQDRGRDIARRRVYRAQQREQLGDPVLCPTCGHPLNTA